MIMIKLVGGAKKSFLTDEIKIDKSDITIQELLGLLLNLKPINTPNLDVENILIAVNGVDSSAMDGRVGACWCHSGAGRSDHLADGAEAPAIHG